MNLGGRRQGGSELHRFPLPHAVREAARAAEGAARTAPVRNTEFTIGRPQCDEPVEELNLCLRTARASLTSALGTRWGCGMAVGGAKLESQAKPGTRAKADAVPAITKDDVALIAAAIREHTAALDRLAEAVASLGGQPGAGAIRSELDLDRFDPDDAASEEVPDGGRQMADALDAAVVAPISILAELKAFFRAPRIAPADKISFYVQGGPGGVAALWEPLDRWPAFRQFGLALGPSDLRFVDTVGDLVNVIAWGLRKATGRIG